MSLLNVLRGALSACRILAQGLKYSPLLLLLLLLQIAEKYPAEFDARKKDKLRYR